MQHQRLGVNHTLDNSAKESVDAGVLRGRAGSEHNPFCQRAVTQAVEGFPPCDGFLRLVMLFAQPHQQQQGLRVNLEAAVCESLNAD